MNKQFKLLFVLLFISISVFAEDRYFKWIDTKTQTRFRINIDNHELLQEVELGKWRVLGKVQVDFNFSEHIAPQVKSQYFIFENGNKIRFPLDGSGQVYDYFPLTRKLIRIDNTFHGGYNYFSNKFLRKGIVYSIGGEGFWKHSNVITYFDEKLKEWEILKPKNIGPIAMCEGYQGYDSKKDVFYSGASHISTLLEDQKDLKTEEFFRFDFRENEWELLGKINSALPFRKPSMILWTGSQFLQFESAKIYILNPELNEVRVFKDNTKIFLYFSDYVVQNDTILAFVEKNSGPFFKIALSDLNKKSTYIGKFYSNGMANYIYYLSSILFVFFLFLAFWIRKNSKKRKNLGFSNLEKMLLNKLLALKPNEFLTTNDINEILDTSDKSQENQRRIRFKVISQINNKLKVKLGSKNGIERKSLPEDKRLTIYTLDSQIVSELRKLLES